MINAAGASRRWRHRAITVIGLGVAAVVGVAAPAFGHPVFSNDPPGFPNPQGSTTSPFPGGARPTLNMFLPFEQDGVVFNGAENTTVEVQVTIPAGWTSPACGAASTTTSVGYRQMGTVVPGWTCVIETVSGHQVLHWHGPQIGPAQTNADSAQFFTFPVTVPSPATTTSYGTTGGPEGFSVKQVYANGATSLWRPPNSTQAGEAANGLVRTVASTTTPPPTPMPNGAKPTAAKPTGAKPTGAKSTDSPPPPPGGGGPASSPATEPPPTRSLTAPGQPSAAAQDSPAPTSTDPPPGVDSQPSSAAEQLAQQRNDTTGHGLRWQVLVGIVLAAVIVVGTVIVVVKRRRRSS